jgi:acyl-CoA thioesterase I
VTPPTSKVTRILAFGDSMTAGTTQPPVSLVMRLDAGKSESYPYKLQTLLTARYTSQTLAVFNAGNPGELATTARSRLARSINDSSPEVVILMEGANDLNSIVGPSTNAGVDATVAAMEDMVRDTTGRGLPVFVATLPPQRAGGSRAGGVNLLDKYNRDLRTMASRKGAMLVDMNALFPLSMIGQDGLHPTEEGYQKMAEIFLDALKQQYEVSPSPAAR